MWHDGDWGAWGWVAMSLMMLVFWGGLVAMVVWLVRGTGGTRVGPKAASPPASNAEELLAQRFARGQIDAEESTHRRGVLHAAAPPAGVTSPADTTKTR